MLEVMKVTFSDLPLLWTRGSISQECTEINSNLIKKSSSSLGRAIAYKGKKRDQHDDIWFSFRCLDIPVVGKGVRTINSLRPILDSNIIES